MVVGVAVGQADPRCRGALRSPGIRPGLPDQHPDCGADLADGLPDDAQGRFRLGLNVGKNPKGLFVTLFVNWIVKPFSMAFFGWIFFRLIFSPWISPADADQYIAGSIILAAAPCTAMVFVWSYLTDGDPAYTLVQVSVNDLLMLVFFAPIVTFLVAGASNLIVPFSVLFTSVVVFIVIPLAAGGHRSRADQIPRPEWFNNVFLPRLHPVAYRAAGHPGADLRLPGRQHHRQALPCAADRRPDHHAGLFQLVACLRPDEWFKLPYSVAAPGALIGASNFFELAVATAITLFGPESGAALARGRRPG